MEELQRSLLGGGRREAGPSGQFVAEAGRDQVMKGYMLAQPIGRFNCR